MTQQPPAEAKPHSLRCETCECGKKRVRILYPNGEEKTRLVKCSKLNQTLTHEEVDVIALVGCASHSAANTDAQTRELPDCPSHTCVVHVGDKEEAPKHYCKRIEAVVKELEERKAKIESVRKVNSSITGGNLAVHVYSDAIALLKGEGK